MGSYERLGSLESKLKDLVDANGVTQEAIFEEMTDKERSLLDKTAGMDYVRAMLNRLGVPIGEQQQQREESGATD